MQTMQFFYDMLASPAKPVNAYLQRENSYWQLIRAKSSPFFSASFQMGALLGNATTAIFDGLVDPIEELFGRLERNELIKNG
jgi:geranylgeranyl pyrophosphate synthase